MVQDFDNEESSNDSKLKRLLSNKLVVAVGASSLSKAISASPFFKIITFKVPASLNLFLTHTHNAMAYALPKWRLLLYGDGIECAAVSLPSAPSIAKLGRGIQNLHEASLEVRSRESNRIQNAIEALRQKLKKFRLQ
ncbi:unnamed protein product [Brassica oleracea]|uniref:(rape) hypothetical protein n=1 Tax=Brassica napus TaxID=3708 RepID=A0A816JYN4_BRANA|nr:unnamed protein product [Brassica napus]